MPKRPAVEAEHAGTTTWRTELRGLRNLPRRLVLTVTDVGRALWWSTFVVVPTVLLAAAAVAGDGPVYGYAMYAAAGLFVVSQTSERFVDASVELDDAAGVLAVTYHMGDPSLFAGGHEASVSFDDVTTARVLRLADHTVVRLRHERPLAPGATALVPPDATAELHRSLRRHGVPVRGPTDAAAPWVWGRCAVTALALGVAPIGVAIAWPLRYSWAVLLVLVLHAVVLPLQGR